jgi:hypothetical protein
MRIGLLAYASNTGLGIQTWAFFRNMKPARVLLVDMSPLNQMPVYFDRYFGDVISCTGAPRREAIEAFLDGLDLVFVCETPLNYDLFRIARKRGVRTVLQFNFELLDYLDKPDLPIPDVFAAPTPWNFHRVPYRNKAHLPVPIDLAEVPARVPPDRVTTFLHINGRPAAEDRNGTLLFCEAARILTQKYPGRFQFLVRTQDRGFGSHLQRMFPEVVVAGGDVEKNAALYSVGEVLVMPRRYGGLCLPAQEALGWGLPVIMPAVSPNETFLPRSWLVPARHAGWIRTRAPVALFNVDPEELAAAMIKRSATIQHDSVVARRLAEQRSWDSLKPRYEEFFRAVLNLPRQYA